MSILHVENYIFNRGMFKSKQNSSCKLIVAAFIILFSITLSSGIARSWTTGNLGNSIPFGHDMHLYIHEEAYGHLLETIEFIKAENEEDLELFTYSFPEWEYVYEYNGLYSPDALYGTKHGLLYDHMYDAKYGTGEGLTAIIRYYNLLVVSLREGDAEVAGFAAAFLGHYLADALSPPHMIDTSKGQRPGGYFLGNLLTHYYLEKSSSSRLRPPSDPIVLDMEFLKLKDIPFSQRIEPYLIDKFLVHRELNTWKIFLKEGWTQEVDAHIFDILIPGSISLTATLWLAAMIEASGQGHTPSMTEFSEELALKEIIDVRFKNHSELIRPFLSLGYKWSNSYSEYQGSGTNQDELSMEGGLLSGEGNTIERGTAIEGGFPLNSFTGVRFGVQDLNHRIAANFSVILVVYRDFLLTHSDVALVYSVRGIGAKDSTVDYNMGVAFTTDIFTGYYISFQLEKPLSSIISTESLIIVEIKKVNVFVENMFINTRGQLDVVPGLDGAGATWAIWLGYGF